MSQRSSAGRALSPPRLQIPNGLPISPCPRVRGELKPSITSASSLDTSSASGSPMQKYRHSAPAFAKLGQLKTDLLQRFHTKKSTSKPKQAKIRVMKELEYECISPSNHWSDE